jgi:hypothetical protein
MEMTEEPLAKGWHPDPAEADLFRYWDGHEWNGIARTGLRTSSGHFSLRGWKKIWYGRILRLPVVFYPLVWFHCSVPGTRGHLTRLISPPQARRPAG